MGSFKQEANDYEPQGYKNISELKSIDIDVVILEETNTDSNDKEYTVKYVEVEGLKYRVPVSVLSNLKDILEENPELKAFKVKRKGTTKEDTRYTVIAL